MKPPFASALLVLALAGTGAMRLALADPITGEWTVHGVAGAVDRLTLEVDASNDRMSTSSATQAVPDLDGPGHHVTFTIARDAGRFVCEGWGENGRGAGTFTFAPNPDYAGELRRRGLTFSSDEKLLDAAMLDLSLAYLDTMHATYPQADFKKLIEMRAVGVDPAYVRSMSNRLGGPIDMQTMISLRAVGVTPDYLDELARLGFHVTRADQAVSLRAVGVNAAYVKELASVGYTNVAPDDLQQMRAVGVDADFIRKMEAHGFHNLSVQRLIQARAVGVF